MSLFFGRRSSPANWGIVSTLSMQFISAHRPASENREGPEAYVSFQYVDDGAFIEPLLSLRPWKCISLWGWGIEKCLGPAAVNTIKREIEGLYDTCVNFWGIDVSTTENTFSLPNDKINKAESFLSTPEFGPRVTRIPSKALQELRGRVEFWSCCNSSLGVEMRFIDRLLVSQSGIINPKGSLREIKQAYIDFGLASKRSEFTCQQLNFGAILIPPTWPEL